MNSFVSVSLSLWQMSGVTREIRKEEEKGHMADVCTEQFWGEQEIRLGDVGDLKELFFQNQSHKPLSVLEPG